LPLIIILLISSTGFISNLKAKEVRPENYGKTNILFNMIAQDELFLEDEESYEEIIEGPLPQETTQTSYLEGEVLISDNEVLEEDEGIDTLVTTTSDSASLISPEITDPEVVTKKRDKVIDYVVQIGDTISTIAQKFSISTNSILWENSLSYYSTIKPGQTLKILPTSGINYKIKSGDTIQKIVKKYGGSTKEIIEFNKLTDASDIVIGQEIIIPSGKKPVSYPVRPSNPTNTSFSQATTVSNAKLQWPTNSSRITQYYGWRHTGLDIGNKTGQPIYASESGKITKAGWNRGGYGYYIMINHGGGLETLYAHLSRIDVKIGQNVSRGQVIGGIGSTGRSTGPHIHFEVRVNNRRSNPLSYIR
jgi:murein DD-endopeptidase MepM/ murein hydrolase activator NlpD